VPVEEPSTASEPDRRRKLSPYPSRSLAHPLELILYIRRVLDRAQSPHADPAEHARRVG
jgi:hypothetical protein